MVSIDSIDKKYLNFDFKKSNMKIIVHLTMLIDTVSSGVGV